MPRGANREVTPDQPAHRMWKRFIRGRARCRHLEQAVLYSIPKRLVRILRRDVPTLLSESDVEFEIALRAHGATAFVNRQPCFSFALDARFLFAPSANSSLSSICPSFDEFHCDAIEDLRQGLSAVQDRDFRERMSATKSNRRMLEKEQELKGRIQRDIDIRLQGYAGWLSTHPEYWIDFSRLQALHGGEMIPCADLPAQGSPALQLRTPYATEANGFLLKWALSRVVTLDLPEPLRPGIFPGEEIPQNGITPCGVSMFLPWPLLGDQAVKYRTIAQYYRTRNQLSHLDNWLYHEPKWGAERYARMLEIYVYLELALKQRYPEQLKGRLTAIDRAFAVYWEADSTKSSVIDKKVESVRPIRQKLHRRLLACQQAVDEHVRRVLSGQDAADRRAEFEAVFEGDEST